jgi:Ca2+-binding EF-hand superfamily protein
MEKATEEVKEEQVLEERVRVLTAEQGLTPETVGMYRRAFRFLDLDGGGTVETRELNIGLTSLGLDFGSEQIETTLAMIDGDGSGEIDFSEFCHFMTCLRREESASPVHIRKSVAHQGASKARLEQRKPTI